MNDDLISRHGVLRLLNVIPSEEFATKAMLIGGVNALPSAQPDVSDTNVGKICEYYDLCRNGRDEKKLREELLSAQPGWIPTSERLPERYDNYLITTEDEDTDIGTFHPEFKQWSICDADGFRLTDGVLAWCELPKPWEGEKDDG